MNIQKNIPLAPLTTFQVGGPARYFVDAHTETEILEAVTHAQEQYWPLFVLGGGSNLVVSDDGWPGLVLRISLPGVRTGKDGANTIFSAGAGETWDVLVALTVSRNCAGLECLSGIPGTVGGTPVQNVGAYGQEVSQTISHVRVLEISSGRVLDWSNAECGFAYRTSKLNTSLRGEYIVLEVTYKLRQDGLPALEYSDVKRFFGGVSAREHPTLQQVRDAVRAIRQSKAMLLVKDDEDCRSAGSFFKNPIVSQTEAQRVQVLANQRSPDKTLPQYPGQDGQVKLPAAWLVEQSGFNKGYSRGPVGISRKHSLAIVNRGGARATDIVALKEEVQKRVFDVWGISLQPEPVFVGFDPL